MLSEGRLFLVSDEITRADLAVYHGLWFLSAMPIDCSAILAPYPKIQSWMKRVASVGTGANEEMTPRTAIGVATQAAPAAVRSSQPMEDDPPLGSVVAVRPEDYRTEDVVGELVLADRNELAIRRMGDQVGEVVVHFPRLGYVMRNSS